MSTGFWRRLGGVPTSGEASQGMLLEKLSRLLGKNAVVPGGRVSRMEGSQIWLIIKSPWESFEAPRPSTPPGLLTQNFLG